MKLVDKFTLWFIGIVILVTPVSMYISYYNIKEKIYEAEVIRLKEINDKIANQLRAGKIPRHSIFDFPAGIVKLKKLPKDNVAVNEYKFYNEQLKRNECRLDVNSFYTINGTNYKISSYNYVTKGEQIVAGMLKAVFWKMLLIILFVAISARLVSRYILLPFKQSLKTIQDFSLKQKEKIDLPHTTTAEFKELNCFLKKMADKATDDYARVKEFSENASHEVQTPLAVIQSKLELLAETCIGENQAALISDMQNAIEKLAKINRSLLLLTKLENQEYETSENIRFCKITREVLSSFELRLQLKNISVNTDIDKNVYLQIHPVLAEILLNNLLSNAIRYNIEDGLIEVTLSRKMLMIKNTGLPPEVPVEQLFRRFKKSNQCADSIGLGLAIVKQICIVNGLSVSYQYADGFHVLEVDFPEERVSQDTEPDFEPVNFKGTPALG